jgi:hypothetical protein
MQDHFIDSHETRLSTSLLTSLSVSPSLIDKISNFYSVV